MPFRKNSRGVTVNVRLTPGARREGCAGVADGGDGKRALKIAVRAKPEDGKANVALIAFVAQEWDVPKSSITLVTGMTSRQKTLLVEGDSEELYQKLENWRNSLD